MTKPNSTARNLVAVGVLCVAVGFGATGCASGKVRAPDSAANFNQKTVDKTLQDYQRVGRKYKIKGKSYKPKHEPKYDEKGVASWYGPGFNGKPTASGEPFDMYAMTAAHPTLPLNSRVHVTNLENGRMMFVRVNDRGPFKDKRIIDLSKAAAQQLGITGLAKVRVQYAGPERS